MIACKSKLGQISGRKVKMLLTDSKKKKLQTVLHGVHVPKALSRGLTWHADTAEASYLVQAGGLVPTGVGHALVDVHLAARPHVTLQTLAVEGALGVDALPPVLTRVGTCSQINVTCKNTRLAVKTRQRDDLEALAELGRCKNQSVNCVITAMTP